MTSFEGGAASDEQPEYIQQLRDVVAGVPYYDIPTAVRDFSAPYAQEPPIDQYALLPGSENMEPVPFTQPEVDAILNAQTADSGLITRGSEVSGVERDYLIESQVFPRTLDELRDRRSAVYGILKAAVTADDLIEQLPEGAIYGSVVQSVEQLEVLRGLPGHIERHGDQQDSAG